MRYKLRKKILCLPKPRVASRHHLHMTSLQLSNKLISWRRVFTFLWVVETMCWHIKCDSRLGSYNNSTSFRLNWRAEFQIILIQTVSQSLLLQPQELFVYFYVSVTGSFADRFKGCKFCSDGGEIDFWAIQTQRMENFYNTVSSTTYTCFTWKLLPKRKLKSNEKNHLKRDICCLRSERNIKQIHTTKHFRSKSALYKLHPLSCFFKFFQDFSNVVGQM